MTCVKYMMLHLSSMDMPISYFAAFSQPEFSLEVLAYQAHLNVVYQNGFWAFRWTSSTNSILPARFTVTEVPALTVGHVEAKAGYIRKIRKYYSGGVEYYRNSSRKHLTVQVLNTEPIWLIGILTSLSTGIVSRISDLVRRSSLISPGPPPVYQCTSARMDELCHWSHNCAMTCGTQLPWDHSHLLPPTFARDRPPTPLQRKTITGRTSLTNLRTTSFIRSNRAFNVCPFYSMWSCSFGKGFSMG